MSLLSKDRSLIHKNIIVTPVAPIHRVDSYASEMITQALIWEDLDIIEKKNNWNYVMMDDQYEGWVNSFFISSTKTFEASFNRFSDNFTLVTKRMQPVYDCDGNIISILSLGSKIPSLLPKKNYLANKQSKIEILLADGSIGFIDKQMNMSNVLNQNKINFQSVIKMSCTLLNVPYLWGGKSSFGYDCSGFVQSIYKLHGIFLKRDSGDMYKALKSHQIHFKDRHAGCLVFFSKNNNIDHVGIVISKTKFIHCSGYVKINSFNKDEADYYSEISDYKLIFISPV